MSRLICVIDEDQLKSMVYPAVNDVEASREMAVEYALKLAKHLTPEYRGQISLINRTRTNQMIIISYRRDKRGR